MAKLHTIYWKRIMIWLRQVIRKRRLVWVHFQTFSVIFQTISGVLPIDLGVTCRLNPSRILKPSSVANALGAKADELEKWRLSLLKTEKAIFKFSTVPFLFGFTSHRNFWKIKARRRRFRLYSMEKKTKTGWLSRKTNFLRFGFGWNFSYSKWINRQGTTPRSYVSTFFIYSSYTLHILITWAHETRAYLQLVHIMALAFGRHININ